MLVKRYRLLVVLTAVMCTALSAVVPVTDVPSSSAPFTTENYADTDSPYTTKPPGGCKFGNQYFAPGEFYDACKAVQCSEGQTLIDDYIHCDNDYNCHTNEVPFPTGCCRPCEFQTTEDYPDTTEDYPYTTEDNPDTTEDYPDTTEDYPDTTEDYPDTTEDYPDTTEDYPDTTEDYPDTTEDYPDTTEDHPDTEPLYSTKPPGGCMYQGQYFAPGETIIQGSCRTSKCSDDGTVHVYDVSCDNYAQQCNDERYPNACCPACEYSSQYYITATEPPSTTGSVVERNTTVDNIEPVTSTTAPPGCIFGNKTYEIGEYVYKSDCNNQRCTAGGIVVSNIFCDTTPQNQPPCNTKFQPNACCPPCKERSRRRRNVKRTTVNRRAFKVSAKRHRLVRKRDALVKP
ncbi:hypothetical protein BsWGS_12089 [Bradybaena similaris]